MCLEEDLALVAHVPHWPAEHFSSGVELVERLAALRTVAMHCPRVRLGWDGLGLRRGLGPEDADVPDIDSTGGRLNCRSTAMAEEPVDPRDSQPYTVG